MNVRRTLLANVMLAPAKTSGVDMIANVRGTAFI